MMKKFMLFMGGFSYRHINLVGGFHGLYRSDGVHLSNVGLDIFNLGLESSIERAMVLG